MQPGIVTTILGQRAEAGMKVSRYATPGNMAGQLITMSGMTGIRFTSLANLATTERSAKVLVTTRVGGVGRLGAVTVTAR